MLFVIIGQDAPGSLEIRRRVRPRHLERTRMLLDQGRLVLAGPMPAVAAVEPGPAGYTGSVIVAEFESIDAARQWVAEDPYVTEGVFASHDVRPFVQVLP
jgi:uncharacterized protein YciI